MIKNYKGTEKRHQGSPGVRGSMTKEQEVLHALGIHNWYMVNNIGWFFLRRVCRICKRVEFKSRFNGWVYEDDEIVHRGCIEELKKEKV